MTSDTKSTKDAISSFVAQHRVHLADVDVSGFLRVDALIRKMEETEYAFLRSRELSVVITDGRGLVGFPRLAAEVDISTPVAFDAVLTVTLSLTEIDGKTLAYAFNVTEGETQIATGMFRVATCRFPRDAPMFFWFLLGVPKARTT